MAFARCEVARCGWVSADWETHHLAGCESTWHVYEEHPDIWNSLFGNRPPIDPDPRLSN